MSRLSRLLSLSIALAGVALSRTDARAGRLSGAHHHVVCASGAGGAVDITTRIITDHMAKTLGQNIVVQNEPGAGGTLSIDQVGKAQPDGYTLLTIGPSVGTIKELFPEGDRRRAARSAAGQHHRPDADDAGGQQGRARPPTTSRCSPTSRRIPAN